MFLFITFLLQILWWQWIHWPDWNIVSKSLLRSLWAWCCTMGCQCSTIFWESCKFCSLHWNCWASWEDNGYVYISYTSIMNLTNLRVFFILSRFGLAWRRSPNSRIFYSNQKNICYFHIFWIDALQIRPYNGFNWLWAAGYNCKAF